jgi:hypothetical protein
MGDLVVLVLVVVAFAALVGLVALCDRIVGPAEAPQADRGEVDRVVR